MRSIVEKKLSANDVGITGGHQAGILIPKKEELRSFFPVLDEDGVNPRAKMLFLDEYGKYWEFSFIYYNNKLRGGTRNEYRLTGMTAFLRQSCAKKGDCLIFEREGDEYYIRVGSETSDFLEDEVVTLVLDNTWKIIKY